MSLTPIDMNWGVRDILFLCVIAAAFAFCAALRKAEGCRRPFLRAACSVAAGLLALFAVNLTGGLTGVTIPCSPLAVGAAAFLGIPGVILLLLLGLFF